MNIYRSDSFEDAQTNHDLSILLKELVRAIYGGGRKLEPNLVKRVENILPKTLISAQDSEFILALLQRLGRGRADSAVYDDVAHALRLLVASDIKLREMQAAAETPEPTEGARREYEEVLAGLRLLYSQRELSERAKRHKALVATLDKLPGLYIAELYKQLLRIKAIHVTYATLWSDIHSLQDEGRILTVGGPQGRARYCFPHPKAIPNRRVYYDGYYCAEGIVEEKLTSRFRPTRRWLDLFLVNSHVESVIVVVDYKATSDEIVGTHVKTFGRLHGFRFLEDAQGMLPRRQVGAHDVLRAFNITEVSDDAERILWHDPRVLAGMSLYPSTTEAMRYSSPA